MAQAFSPSWTTPNLSRLVMRASPDREAFSCRLPKDVPLF